MDPQTRPSQLLSLPSELLLEITKYLPLRDLLKLHLSCRRLHCLFADRFTAEYPQNAQHILRWSVCRNSPRHLARALAAGATFHRHYLSIIIRHDRAELLRAVFTALPDYRATINPSLCLYTHDDPLSPVVPLARHPGESRELFSVYLPPLHLAAGLGATGCVGVLLDVGATPDTVDYNGETALNYADKRGYWHVMELLLEGGASWAVDLDDLERNMAEETPEPQDAFEYETRDRFCPCCLDRQDEAAARVEEWFERRYHRVGATVEKLRDGRGTGLSPLTHCVHLWRGWTCRTWRAISGLMLGLVRGANVLCG